MKDRILKIIKQNNNGITFHLIKDNLYEGQNLNLREINSYLTELINDKEIFYRSRTNTYHLKDKSFLVGTFSETRHAYSFIEVDLDDGTKESYFCPAKFASNALDGDTVKFKLLPSKNRDGEDSFIAKVVRIIKRNGNNILGVVTPEEGGFFLKTMELFQKHKYKIINPQDYKDNNFVVAKFVDYKNDVILVKVEELLSETFSASIDHLYVLKKFSKKITFPDQIKALKASDFVKDEVETDRKDLRDELIYTIDGKTSKDLDDAVSLSKDQQFYYLKVHIADVSHYVREDDLIDQVASERTTSIYLIDYVLPMLPEILSNDLCSLNPNTEKLAMTIEMKINENGEIVASKMYKSTIISKYRLFYEEVDAFLAGDDSVYADETLKDNLKLANELSQILHLRKIGLGMIDFVLPEIKVEIDENKEPVRIYNKFQTKSERIIEDLMVAANETVAKYLIDRELNALFRIHLKPLEEKLEALRLFSKTIYRPQDFKSQDDYNKILGFVNKHASELTSKDLAEYISIVSELPNHIFLKVNLIQTMEKARYEIDNMGHYALGLQNYLHFTSPIRRYPDLIVHREIKKFLKNKDYKQDEAHIKYLEKMASLSSEREKEAVQIERGLTDIKRARFLVKLQQEQEQSYFVGRVVNILSFGFFIDVDNQFQGLIRYQSMEDDEYSNDEQSLKVVGKNNKKIIRLFDEIKISIKDVNIAMGTIDMELYNESDSK